MCDVVGEYGWEVVVSKVLINGQVVRRREAMAERLVVQCDVRTR
jgi:hypothetical protein